MFSKENFKLSIAIESIDDLLRCTTLASLLEISGWPKPGNVHRTKNFESTRFEHFLVGTVSVQPKFRDLCENIFKYQIDDQKSYGFVKLGEFFKEAAEKMMECQNGGNVILGHILILAPLTASVAICLKTNNRTFNNFVDCLNKVINDSTIQDTINLYEAIRTCNPGGLGNIEKYDINDLNSIKEIQANKINLKKVFELSKDYDLISLEYSSCFNIILNEGVPCFFNIYNQTKNINIATVNTFLKILADHPDTLIIRKSGKEEALLVSKKAAEIVKNGGISTQKGLKMTNKLDNFLQEKEGKMNPGTTADIIAGIIFCCLVFGLRF